MRLREYVEKDEDERLAPWAARARHSVGRVYGEPEHSYRTAFQRDRDRVLHSTAFRRLQYKTQVFVYHEGDHFRNRLTHTLEVAQVARTIARTLGCNEDLTEAIVLAHDLGHTPFGHAGEHAMHELLAAHGGFEHNRQSLRVVDLLEVRTDGYPGLNLTHETRAGILKHGSDLPGYPHPAPLPQLDRWPCAEAQIADRSDGIAYQAHDIDDGLRSGILLEKELRELDLWQQALAAANRNVDGESSSLRAPVIVALIDLVASDLASASEQRLEASGAQSAEDVRHSEDRLIEFSPAVRQAVSELSRFLSERFYRHHQVARMAAKAQRILRNLWTAYTEDRRLLPPQVLARSAGEPPERAIADYLAGMTDRFAMDEHRKLFDPHAHI